MAYKAYIFDLDGTLLDTIADLVAATNAVLADHNMPTHTREEILNYVGSGGATLLSKAAPHGTSAEELDEMYVQWEKYLDEYGTRMTCAYAGIPELLSTLKAKGARLAVLSNKPDSAAKLAIEEKLPGVFDFVHGRCDEFPRKPDPTGLNKLLGELGVSAKECLYIGDSANDVGVARAAYVQFVGVDWGYGQFEGLYTNKPDVLISRPEEILEF